MKRTRLILAIGCGGAIGALTRHLLGMLFNQGIGLPEWVSVMMVNLIGCYLIGLVFFWIEGVLNRDLQSPLARSTLSRPLVERGWWPEADRTRPVVQQMKGDLRAELAAGFLITGILGGMTTFSLFSLLSVKLLQSAHPLILLANVFGTVLLGLIATHLGLRTGRMLVGGSGSRSPSERPDPS